MQSAQRSQYGSSMDLQLYHTSANSPAVRFFEEVNRARRTSFSALRTTTAIPYFTFACCTCLRRSSLSTPERKMESPPMSSMKLLEELSRISDRHSSRLRYFREQGEGCTLTLSLILSSSMWTIPSVSDDSSLAIAVLPTPQGPVNKTLTKFLVGPVLAIARITSLSCVTTTRLDISSGQSLRLEIAPG
jgi:hypothetical protein